MLTPERIEECREFIFEGLEDGNGEDLNPLLNELCNLALRGLNAGHQWRTMDSAPKRHPEREDDAFPIWAHDPNPLIGNREVIFMNGEWVCRISEIRVNPILWRYLPTPPAMKEKL